MFRPFRQDLATGLCPCYFCMINLLPTILIFTNTCNVFQDCFGNLRCLTVLPAVRICV